MDGNDPPGAGPEERPGSTAAGPLRYRPRTPRRSIFLRRKSFAGRNNGIRLIHAMSRRPSSNPPSVRTLPASPDDVPALPRDRTGGRRITAYEIEESLRLGSDELSRKR